MKKIRYMKLLFLKNHSPHRLFALSDPWLGSPRFPFGGKVGRQPSGCRRNDFSATLPQQGAVLLMALLVMAAIMATATGLSVIVIGQLRITRSEERRCRERV